MENITRRLKLFGIEECPHFTHTELQNLNSINHSQLRNFIVQDETHESASINVFKVVGTKHPDYAGRTWLDLLVKGKRMEHNLKRFIENPSYYLEGNIKEPYIHYISYDGDAIYIGDEGNHRTCIARFFFHAAGKTIMHGVRLNNFTVDWAFKDLYDKAISYISSRKLPIYISMQSKVIERNDAANWKTDRYQIGAKVRNNRKEYELDFTDFQDFYYNLQKPWWKKVLRSQPNTDDKRGRALC